MFCAPVNRASTNAKQLRGEHHVMPIANSEFALLPPALTDPDGLNPSRYGPEANNIPTIQCLTI
jgi:hypothetical protein